MDRASTSPDRLRGSGTGRIFFGWYIVFGGMLLQALGYSTRHSFAVFFPVLLDQFNWPRDLGASILSTHLLFYGVAAPFAGGVIDRIGSRKTMVAGTILLASGLALSSLGRQPFHFYLSFGILCGTGLSLLGAVPLTMIIRNWFERRRTIALSLVFLGSGMASACYPGVVWLIDTFGWNFAYIIEGLIIAVFFGPIISLILVHHPREKGLTRDGLIRGEVSSAVLEREVRRVVDREWAAKEWTLPQAVRTHRFWMMCLATFTLWGVGHHLIITHQIAFAIDVGYSWLFASAVLSLGGWMSCLGALTSMISDRIGREPVATIGIAVMVSSVMVLMKIEDARHPWMLYYFSLSFGFGNGMCSPVVAAMATDIFQGPRVGATVGFIWFSFAIGGTIGPWLGGLLYELTGGYRLAFTIAAVLFLFGSAAVWIAGPRRVRLVPGKVG